MLASAVFAVVFFGALVLMAEDRSKDKLQTYGVTAGCLSLLLWLLSMVYWLFLPPLIIVVALVLWTCYKWLDFTILRSVGVLVALFGVLYGVSLALGSLVSLM